ncbi:hypothetical protein Pint_06350 [Pistacia integerrima]|uniref:Uncharacterized protein n=1 Tax=Pistacia integerrima TaxID=434235 RepID=A0ACC0Z4A4_9ROSI|nr:hypothetical protein Pint_06350 [Pistacia integerrima]
MNMSLNGAAEIEDNGLLKLTNTTSRVLGHAFYSSPIKFKNSTDSKSLSFSTCFAFAIINEYPELGGHGFAFTISPTKELVGALPSQYLGLLNASDNGNLTNQIFAVEFDTVQDFEFGDINGNHVGIDIDSMISNASATAAYFLENSTKQELNLKSGKVIQAWIDYDSETNRLDVKLSPFSAKPTSSILSIVVDLSSIIRDTMYVGFSASTGMLSSSHYILGWSFNMSGEAESLTLSSLPSLPGPKKSHTALIVGVSVSAFLFTAFVVGIAFYLVWKIKNADVIEDWELDVGPHRFSYQELKKATRGFRDKELLGFGGFGRVYKGTLPNTNTQVAVKRISRESKQGLREFISEIASIGRLRHRNLVQLLGWCRRRGDLLLVYDYMPNVVCGRKPIEPKALPEELVLVDWVWDRWKGGAILEVVDSRLNGEFDEIEAIIVVKLGLMCSNNSPYARPTMRQVVRYLEGEVALPEVVEALDESAGISVNTTTSGGGGQSLEFEDFVHSYPNSSYYEKVSNWSSPLNDADVDLEVGLSSPVSLTVRDDAR